MWHLVTIATNGGEHMNYFYFWTYWSWTCAIISQIFSLLAAHNPEYWHVTAFAWLQVSHSLNLAVTFCFWVILTPVIIIWIRQAAGSTWTPYDYFMIFHMTVLHGTPLIMTWTNIYYTDIKLQIADWKLMAFHGLFYIFANYLGFFDHD